MRRDRDEAVGKIQGLDGLVEQLELEKAHAVRAAGVMAAELAKLQQAPHSDNTSSTHQDALLQVSGLQSQVHELQQQLASASAANASLQQQTSDVDDLRQQLASASAANASLQQQLDVASTTTTGLQQRLDAASTENAGLQQQASKLQELRDELAAASTAKNYLQLQIAASAAALKRSQDQYVAERQRVTDTHVVVRQQEAQLEKLKHRVGSAEAQASSAITQHNTLLKHYVELHRRYTTLQGESCDVHQRHLQLQQEYALLQHEWEQKHQQQQQQRGYEHVARVSGAFGSVAQ